MERILSQVREVLDDGTDKEQVMKKICELLHEEVDHYDWVGFYLVEDGELVLGPYVGEPTEHTNIDFGEGICGQAVESEETFLVDDVSEEDNYLACSLKVKSEIVVPIFRDDEIVGEIDIDSHEKEAFDKEDEELLGKISEEIGPML